MKKYSIVVAHPDDEILWASSLLINAELIIICFSGIPNNRKISDARKELQQKFPLPNTIFLNINQASNSLIPTDWKSAETSNFGMKYGK